MIELYSRKWTKRDLSRFIGSINQVAGIKSLEASDGFERGGRLFEVWTGSGLSFHVLADRALDISTCQYKGMSLTWRSPIGDAHPAYYDASGSAWLRSFQGGMLVTCGLDTFGPPNRNENDEFGLHGRISNTPARVVNHSAAWVEDEYRLEISAEVRQARIFGENLVMHRRISTSMGSSRIRIDDVVTNEGFSTQRHMILYHVNIGFPLLSENSRLKFDVSATIPEDEVSDHGGKDWMLFQPPTSGYLEQNFIHTPIPNNKGWAVAEVVNPEINLALRLSFDTSTLPYLNEWKMMGEGLYVLGIEPMNCAAMKNIEQINKQGLLPSLEAGESRNYSLEIEVVEYS
jgi:hypothetical protein